jgi:hypothetical protein
MLRSFLVPAAAVGVVLLAPAGAGAAASYLVTSCHDPLGQPNAAAGWNASFTAGGVTVNTCAGNGSLGAALPAARPLGNSTANWRFDAPPGTRIVRVLARRSTIGFGPSNEPQDVSYLMRTNNALLETCAPSPTSSCVADLTAPLDKQGLDGTYVEFRVLCTNAGSTCTRPVAVEATHVYVGLADPSAPVVSDVRVIDSGDASGKLTVAYNAADVGGGLYRALVKVDGKVAQALPLAPAPCSDVNPSDADPYEFNVPVPCPATVAGAQVGVDVRSLSAGPHSVEFAVEDAAGNESSVYGAVQFPRPNVTTGSSVTTAQALRGRLRMWFVKAPNRGRRYRSRFGTRVVTRGVLRTPEGRAIQGARIDVYHIRNGHRRLLKTGLKSRSGGKLTLILPLNVDTRTIEYAYRALRPGPITSRQRLRLTVLRKGRIYHRR